MWTTPARFTSHEGGGQRSYKAFIAIFVCLVFKAIHLEVASGYSSETFLAAFRRFTSRRSFCEELFSDYGINFIGTDKTLMFRASSFDGHRIATLQHQRE